MKERVRVAVVILLALLALPLTLWDSHVWEGLEYFQNPFGLEINLNLVVTTVYPDSPATAAGVRVGDSIAPGTLSFEARALLEGDREARAGNRVSFRIVRGLTTRDVTLAAVRPAAIPAALLFTRWVANYIAILFVGIGALLVLLRPGRMTWAFYLFCLGVRPEISWAQKDAPLWLNYAGAWFECTLFSLGSAGIIVFVARFPDDRTVGWTRIVEWVALPIFLLQFAQGALPLLLYFAPVPGADWVGPANSLGLTATFTLVFVTLLIKWKRADEAQRPSLRLMLLGQGVGSLGEICVDMAAEYLALPTLWFTLLTDTLPIVVPICAAYAIVRHHALNLGFVANRILLFGLLAIFCTTAFLTIDFGISAGIASPRASFGICMALALAAGLGIQASYRRLVVAIDRIFFRQRYSAAMTRERIQATVARDGSIAHEQTAAELAHGLDLSSIALFRRSADGGFIRETAVGWPTGTAWHLLPTDELARSLHSAQRQIRLNKELFADVPLPAATARPTIALPLKRAGRIEGAILIGQRASDAFLDRDEARGIAELFTEVARA
jgi:hypothetical protein